MSMQFNAELAHRVLDYIKAHPEEWDQTVWSCGTAHCFAGHVVWMHDGPFEVTKRLLCNMPDHDCFTYKVTREGRPIDISSRAAEILGVKKSPIFLPSNTIEEIERIINAIEMAEANNDTRTN